MRQDAGRMQLVACVIAAADALIHLRAALTHLASSTDDIKL
jgi:hypothetical protein